MKLNPLESHKIFLPNPICAIFEGIPSAVKDFMLPLPGLAPVLGKAVVARFDGGQLSSDAGVLVLREIAQRLGLAERLLASTIPAIRTRLFIPCGSDRAPDADDCERL
jgi:hypothetical protein